MKLLPFFRDFGKEVNIMFLKQWLWSVQTSLVDSIQSNKCQNKSCVYACKMLVVWNDSEQINSKSSEGETSFITILCILLLHFSIVIVSYMNISTCFTCTLFVNLLTHLSTLWNRHAIVCIVMFYKPAWNWVCDTPQFNVFKIHTSNIFIPHQHVFFMYWHTISPVFSGPSSGTINLQIRCLD